MSDKKFRMDEQLGLGSLATFVPNKDTPVYNWFYYKEGFARELAVRLIAHFGLKAGDRVLDPFCGSGTTLLACREHGIDSVGLDVHPVAVFAATVKTRQYDAAALMSAVKLMLKQRFRKPDIEASPLLARAFKRQTLEDVIFFRNGIMEMIGDKAVRDFLMLGLMNAAIKCSFAWKDGAVLKFRKKPVPPLRGMLRRQWHRMIHDTASFPGRPCATDVAFCDARRMRLGDGIADAVITSPPYLNKIEYTRVYSIEEELFFARKSLPQLRSYIGAGRVSEELESAYPNMPEPARLYFADMQQVISELSRVCRSGARLGIVVGNGCFPEGVVDSDVVLSEIAEKHGFRADEIVVLNERMCTRERTKKVGVARESLLLWRKE